MWYSRPISSSPSISRCGAGWCGRTKISLARPRRSRRRAVIQAAAQRHFASGTAAARQSQSALGDLIARITGRNVGALTSDAKLEGDLNLSSMDRVELMSALEDRYQVDLKEANFANVSTVADLERLLHEPQKSPQSGYRYPRWAQRWPITWIREFIYYLLTWPATLIMAHPTIVGRENLRGLDGPFLVSCNHVTYIDLGFALKALPPRLRRKLAVGMWGELLWEMWRPPQNWNWFMRLSYRVGYYLVWHCSTSFLCRSSRECVRVLPMPVNRSIAATACWFIPKAAARLTASRRPFARDWACWRRGSMFRCCRCASTACTR